ncbi:hypothetical protein CEXT_57461 [Caerostris extrusa]|uniref:Uncharacterized protein n=1 Tax=Caerostris extrusa TaxID=172846 RepID=A0AAV4NRT0_CAEEX|nr:hypothetical protein CEXT_57461 [Caerostris extrusa]
MLYADTGWKISWKMLRFYPYKISRVQELKMADYEKCWTFLMGINSHWTWKIWWGNEAHFYLNGSINTVCQNCRMWASERYSEHTSNEGIHQIGIRIG